MYGPGVLCPSKICQNRKIEVASHECFEIPEQPDLTSICECADLISADPRLTFDLGQAAIRSSTWHLSPEMKRLLKEGKIIFSFISKRLGLSVAVVAAATGTFDKEVPLETRERHCLSLQESPFGNEATKDSLHLRTSPLRRGHFNEQLPLYFPCGPIHCCGRRPLGGRGRLI